MRKNPLNKGIIMENAVGIGTVTSEMVQARARELAAINGHPSKPSEADYQQAKRELTGESEIDPQEESSESIPESEGWDPCRARPDGKQQIPSEKTKMPRDGARVPRCLKKALPKRSTIKCVRHPVPTRRATNHSHNSRARAVRLPRAKPRRVAFFTRFYVAYSTARPGDNDDLFLDSLHEVLLPSLYHSKAPSLIAERARFVEHARGSSVTCFPFS